jgi:hypothetical protein
MSGGRPNILSRTIRWARVLLLAVLMLAGIAYGLHTLPAATRGRIGATRVLVDGSGTEASLAAGHYDIFYEPPGGYNVFSVPHDVHAAVAPVGGTPLPLHGYFGSDYIGSDGSKGKAMATVNLPHAGLYEISAVGGSDAEGSTVVLATPTGWAMIRMVGSLVVALFAFIALCSVPGRRRVVRLGARAVTFDGATALAPRRTVVQAPRDKTSRLELLARLHDGGVLSDEEFEAQRQRITDGSVSA